MSAEFVPLADVLRPVERDRVSVENIPAPDAGDHPAEPRVAAADAERIGVPDGIVDALRDVRLFRARVADALDDAQARLLRELATAVLGRELRAAPCDLTPVVRRIADRAPVVRVRVAPSDVARVHGFVTVGDPALQSGDAIVELSGGAVDARLGVRLAAVLEAAR